MEDFLGNFSCAGVVCHCLLLNSLHICPYSIPCLLPPAYAIFSYLVLLLLGLLACSYISINQLYYTHFTPDHPLHITSLHSTSLHPASIHFTTLHSTTLHSTSLHRTSPHFTSPHFTPLHRTSLHFASPHFTPLHFTALHFTTLHTTSLPIFHFSLLDVLHFWTFMYQHI
jgi:hypothetical protein